MRSTLAFLLFLSTATHAQEKIMAAAENGKPYLTKKVGGGETLSSLGRHFSLTANDLAAFNKIDRNAGLRLGQELKIPLVKGNLFLVPCTICQKVYYVVPPGEGLYRIATNFNVMGVANLKKLNNLSSENVEIGQELLVGYLKDGDGQAINAIPEKTAPKEKPIEKGMQEKKEPVKAIVKETPPPKTEVRSKEVEDRNPVAKQQILDEGMRDPNRPQPEVLPSAFASQYNGKLGMESGTSAIFKSTSGWNDNKYYVLMSGVTPGIIIKVIASGNNKAIYAKVLGELPAIRQNEDILLRLSNAAVAVLGGGDGTMQVTVSY
ncbi:MAG: LysM peptidoglycan-binding domain-containing protein [Chitinophagaceae bacterium]